MAYSIRYGPEPVREKRPAAPIRSAVCAGFLAGTLLLGQLLPAQGAQLRQMLAGEPETRSEQATQTLVRVLSQGGGWRHALAAFCAEMLEPGESDGGRLRDGGRVAADGTGGVGGGCSSGSGGA